MPAIDAASKRRVLEKLRTIESQYAQLEKKLEDPDVLADHKAVRDVSIKKAALQAVVDGYRSYQTMEREVAELEAASGPGGDRELAELAREEIPALNARMTETLERVVAGLVTAEDRKIGSVMMELRAGTGGDEAALWARDLLEMYQKYCIKRGWTVDTLDFTPESDAGGLRNATINIKGEGVWSELAFEAGVHSVKRVPATESQGRVHTSTASVAVLPEPEEVDVKIDWGNDVEEFATRAQGPGGQNVNKVETAWQIHHKPSGIIIKMMEAKSQQQNREKARRLLLTRLYDLEQQKVHAERSAARKTQIGTGDRSEKIRTYRYKDGIVADERLPGQYGLREILAGELTELIQDLIAQETAKRIAAL